MVGIVGASPRKLRSLALGGASAPAPGKTAGPTPLGPSPTLAAPSTLPAVGRTAKTAPSTLDAEGRLRVSGKLLTSASPADAERWMEAARAVDRGPAELGAAPAARRAKLAGRLAAHALALPVGKKPSAAELALSSAVLSLLLNTARSLDGDPRRAALAALVKAIDRLTDLELAAFYLRATEPELEGLGKADRAIFDRARARALPPAPLVEEWTDGRTKPLELRMTIHPEFWGDEIGMFSKANGFTRKPAEESDGERVFRATLEDPKGARPPLEIRAVVRKGEFDYLEPMGDPAANVVIYSGHSSLGGNGSEAIQSGPAMKGKHPKLVLVASCRARDNYSEFSDKYPGAHLITTLLPTYSISGRARIEALFDTFARGESYAHARKHGAIEAWDEPKTNYVYPDEPRKFGLGDGDVDGQADVTVAGVDRLYDLEARGAARKFLRAIEFTNSVLYYHHEVDAENKKKSYFGPEYADRVFAAGPAEGLSRLVEVTTIAGKSAKKPKGFGVRFDPAKASRLGENLYAALATREITEALGVHKQGSLTQKDALRAVLFGAQAIHYLEVDGDESGKTYQRYFARCGLTAAMKEKDIEKIFSEFDAHANDAQVKGFGKMLETKYGVDLDAWFAALPKANG